MLFLNCCSHEYEAISNVYSKLELSPQTTHQHPCRTQQVVCWMPLGWLGDDAVRRAGVALLTLTQAIFKASNHEPYM